MTTNRTCSALVTSALALAAWPKTGWAQGAAGPQVPSAAPSSAAASGAATTVVVVGMLLGVVVVLGVIIKFFDLKRKREAEAVAVQARISDAILRDSRFFSLPITPSAHVPLWKGTPVTVDIAGQVPSEDLREAVTRLVEREAAQLGTDVRIESRLGVVPTVAPSMAQRSA